MGLVVRVLGPLEVLWDGRTVPVKGARERALLALLALRVGQAVSTERLVDELWEGDPPESGAVSLRVLVSRLRKALSEAGAGDDAIVTRPAGYALRPDVEVDAVQFEALASRGRTEWSEGRAEMASATLRDALSLWRAPELAAASGETARGESARLEESRIAALEARIEADLACGRHWNLVGELEALTTAHPFREGLWAARMVALYRCGRQVDALAAYQALRRLMVDELGIDPSPPLRRLEAAVLAQDDAQLLVGPPAFAPGWGVDTTPSVVRQMPVARVPLPRRMAISPVGGVIGRRLERDALATTLQAVARGEGPVMVMVAGEAGLGKTTLLAEAARVGHAAGAAVLYGRSDQQLAIPYQVFLEALLHYVLHASDEMLALHHPRQLAELSRVLPAVSERRADLPGPSVTDPDAERWLLFGAVASVLTDVATKAPVMVILDDLHWAERPSIQLLRHLARTSLGRVLVVAAYRETELAGDHPLTEALVSLRTEPTVQRLTLRGLDQDEVVAFVESQAGQRLELAGVALAQRLQRETGGNPFFVSELLRHLAETGALTRGPEGRWMATVDIAAAGLPESVREVVSARVDRLGQEARAALSAAAVIGQQFDLDLLGPVTGLAEERLLEVLEIACQAGLVSETPGMAGQFHFSHALSQHALYAGMSAARLARMHLSVAEALETICGDDPGERVGQLARHFVAASRPASAAKAMKYARRAAERALAGLAPDEAVRWYSEALDVLAQVGDEKDGPERARLLAALGHAQREAGDPAYRETLLAAAHLARQFDDTETVVAAALANNRGWQSGAGQLDEERVGALEAALAAIGEVDRAERALLLSLLAVERTYDGNYAGRRALVDASLAVARRLNDPAILLAVLNRSYQAVWVPANFEDRRALTAEALTLAAQGADPTARFWAAIWRAAWAYEAADLAEFRRCITLSNGLAAEVGQPILRWTNLFQKTTVALLAGDAEQADGLATEALQVGNDTGQPDALAIYGAQLVVIRWQQGRTEELVDLVAGIAAANAGIPAYRAALALLYADAGREDDLRPMLAEGMAAGFAHPDDYLLLSAMVAWSEAAVLLREPLAATVLYDRLTPWPDQVAITGASVLGAVAHSLGALGALLERYDEAEEYFIQALAIHQRLEAPFFIARTQLEWGRMLLARDGATDRKNGRDRLEAARGLAEQYDCQGVRRRAEQILATNQGRRKRRRDPSHS